jgi:peptidoglycan/xylan/chitin deacetylase (PgdA/CDA1 family)
MTLVLVVVIVSADSISTVSLAAPTETHGAITIAFDDGTRSQYDYAFPLMQARGIVGTFYVITDYIRNYTTDEEFYMSLEELQAIQNYGNEIGSHSKSHPDFTGLSEEKIREECEISRQVLLDNGFSADNFAYPYGCRNDYTDSIVAEYYRSGRSAYDWESPPMQLPIYTWLLTALPGETGSPDVLSQLEMFLDLVESTNGWLIIFFHSIVPGANNELYTISSEDFESFLDLIVSKDIPTITVKQGLELTSPPTSPPSVMIAPTSVRKYIGQSQTFSSSVSEGNPPFKYQWYLNGTAVSGATDISWVFTPATAGTYEVYLNVTDGLNFEVRSNIVSDIMVYPHLSVLISPVSVNMIVGGSQTFSSSISGGAPPYSYQWFLNDTLVLGATGSEWSFTPRSEEYYGVYVNVTDGAGFRVQSNVADVLACSVYLVLTLDSSQARIARGQSATVSVDVFNRLDPVLESSLALTVTGPRNYSYFEVQPISVSADTVREYSFTWDVPNVAGTYTVEVGLVPAQLTAYDTVWLNVP